MFKDLLCILEHSIDGDDAEEKARLIEQVYQLQNTLDGKCECSISLKFDCSVLL